MSPTQLHLAIFLAFHRSGENSDTIATMVWPNGAAHRTITNTMGGLRQKLGQGADGQWLFPHGRANQYVHRLSNRVVTDWDRFLALTKQADKLPPDEGVVLLDEALNLVNGPPFRAAAGYSWAYSDGTVTMIAETVKAVAARAVDIHIDRGELLEAGRIARVAAEVCDVEVSDEPLFTKVADALRRSPSLDETDNTRRPSGPSD